MNNIYVVFQLSDNINELVDKINELLLENNKVIFLGEHLDLYENIYTIKGLYEKYPNQIVVLKGEQEQEFIETVKGNNKELEVLQKYVTFKELKDINKRFKKDKDKIKMLLMILHYQHDELLLWLEQLETSYQVDEYIFASRLVSNDTNSHITYQSYTSNSKELIIMDVKKL